MKAMLEATEVAQLKRIFAATDALVTCCAQMQRTMQSDGVFRRAVEAADVELVGAQGLRDALSAVADLDDEESRAPVPPLFRPMGVAS